MPGAWNFSSSLIGTQIENTHESHEGVHHWHVQKLTIAELRATAGFGLRPGLGVELTESLREVKGRIRFEDLNGQPFYPPNGDIHHRNETLIGLTDPELSLHLGRSIVPWSVSARIGFSVPIGRTEENPFELGRQGLRHQHIQFGTGTWDPVLGVSVGRRAGMVGLELGARARFPLYENSHDYQAGNRYGVSAAANRALGQVWHTRAALALNREEAERWAGRIEEEGNLGRTDLLLAVGLARTFEPIGSLGLEAIVPLVTRVSGAQIDYPLLVSIQWQR